MIKVIHSEGQHLVLYLGTKEVIDKDIFRLLDWYSEEYGTYAMYDMLLAYSREKILEVKENTNND